MLPRRSGREARRTDRIARQLHGGAAVLALHNADQFECDYVGMTQAAKHYGRMRMFLLRRAAPHG